MNAPLTIPQRRALWLAEQAARYTGTSVIDPEAKLAAKGSGSRPLAIAARCRQCDGAEDPGTSQRIAHCAIQTCPLHPHRPYQPGGYRENLARLAFEAPAAPPAGTVLSPIERARFDPCSRPLAVKAYCYGCMGGQPTGQRSPNGAVRRMVGQCAVVSCAIWDVRPWQTGDSDAEAEIGEDAEPAIDY